MGSYHSISTKYENAIYERGEDNYYVVKIKDIDGSAYVDPSTCSITITNPCDAVLVNADAMTKDSLGVYYYSYSIPTTATYGRYEIEVTTSSPTYTTIYKDKFYILPWNIIYDVRRFSGITSKKSISDHDIAGIIWESYKEALDAVYTYCHNDIPNCNPDTGEWFNGTNMVFETKQSPIADFNGDGVVNGWGEASCGTDISGWWKDADGNCHRLNVTVNDAHCGNISITQTDGTPIPSDAEWVHLDYHVEWESYDENLFRFAVAYLAAHKCIERFRELGSANLSDLDSSKEEILADKKRMLREYRKVIRRIQRPNIGAGMVPGES